MSQTNPSIIYAGLDIAKDCLQLDLAGQSHHLSQDSKGLARLLKLLRGFPTVHVICEATGGYERPSLRALHAAAIPVSLVEAGRIRHFARAQGRRAKTDPIDARVLAAFGAALSPAPTPPPNPAHETLRQFTSRRQQLIDTLLAEKNRASHYLDPLSTRQSRALVRLLEKQIAQCDQAILQCLKDDAGLSSKATRLDAIPGVGPTTAAVVLAEMPELGTLRDEAAAALAGVAPFNRDSGQQTKPRPISGGRLAVRSALYMAALSAVRYDRILHDLYTRLRSRGKKPKVALVAVMRKLIILMNRLLKNPNFVLAP